MSEGKKRNWWVTVWAPLLVMVAGGIILVVFDALREWIAGFFAAIPPTVYWVLGLCAAASASAGFVAGQRAERARRRGKWITRAAAEASVLASNYWSKIKRRRKLLQLRAEADYNRHGIERDPPDHLELAEMAIAPARDTPDVDAILQQFWDDRPNARDGDLYHRYTLLSWLAAEAQRVELPSVY